MSLDQGPKKEPRKHSKKLKIICSIALPLIVLLIFGYVLLHQNNKVKSLNSKVTALNTKVSKLNSQNSKLNTQNSNLSKSVAALKKVQTATKVTVTAQPSNSTTQTQASASLVINSVKLVPPSYLGSTYTADTSNSVEAVSVTMKNLSSSTQTYTLDQFSAINNTGEIINPIHFANDGQAWYTSSLIAGGSTTEYIPFEVSDNIVTLAWTPTGSQTINLAIPSPSQ
ncbi:MAG: hypothetical protein WDN66_05880 [Candidatus Saccharibacteria bacterium]